MKKEKSNRNQTLTCSKEEIGLYSRIPLHLNGPVTIDTIRNRIIQQDFFDAVEFLPEKFIDLLIIDPPYNITKNYDGNKFSVKSSNDYIRWFDSVILNLLRCLKPEATIYVCSDWKTSTLIYPILDKCFHVQNRITWKRDKGRGCKANWKNNTEDIWFCTYSKHYYFNVEAVKLKKRVIAPYTKDGEPKDWIESKSGKYRMTHPSNIWDDVTIPFWSMPENTDHPTQKPEKLIAKLIMASSRQDDFIFDPFLGSGTTAVVAKKLNRCYSGIEQSIEYCCLAEKRLDIARTDKRIQGYENGVFLERNFVK